MKKSLILCFLTGLAIFVQGQNTWGLDPTNSSIQFEVSHLLISKVPGTFNNFNAQINTQSDDGFDQAKLEAVIKVESIDTGNKQRDQHLLQSDFLKARLSQKSHSTMQPWNFPTKKISKSKVI